MEVDPLEPQAERDPMRICAPVGSEGPRCSICASCIADTRAVENEFLRWRIAELEAVLNFYASEDIMMMIGGDRGNAARKVLKASAPTSGDRTESAPRTPVVEPSLWDPEAEEAASERQGSPHTGEEGPGC